MVVRISVLLPKYNRRHLGGLAKVLVQVLDHHLVVHVLALHNLDSLEDSVGLLGGDGKFGHSVCSDFFDSSSMSMIRRERALTSLSTSLKVFSFSSRDSVALVSLSLVSSNPISRFCTFLP